MKKTALLVAILLVGSVFGIGDSRSEARHNGAGQTGTDHHKGVNARGDHAMGFSHEKTTHHFRLRSDGGVIEVTAKEAADLASRDQIRRHLRHIAHQFTEGDFSAPMYIHDKEPPGVSAMKKLKDGIEYRYEEIENGARVVISSGDSKAVASIHEFLKFQISDHRTGDSGKIEH